MEASPTAGTHSVASTPGLPAWVVEMDLKLQDGRHNPGLEQVEQIVEFMERTEGVRSATAVLRGTGVFVAVELLAVDPASAVDRARGLALSSARFAGLGAITSACLKLTME